MKWGPGSQASGTSLGRLGLSLGRIKAVTAGRVPRNRNAEGVWCRGRSRGRRRDKWIYIHLNFSPCNADVSSGVGAGTSDWQVLLGVVPGRLQKGWPAARLGHPRQPALPYPQFPPACSLRVFFFFFQGNEGREESFQQKHSNVLYMQSVVVRSFHMECILKKAVSLTMLLKGGSVLCNRISHSVTY